MAVLLTGTRIGGHSAIHAGNMADHGIITTSNIGSYALTGVPANVITTSGGQTIAGITYFSNGESLNLYGIRGRFTNEYIHLYNKVGIGHPAGWGQGEGNTPGYGLSTYGGATIAYGNSAGMSVYGSITTDTYVYTNYSVRVGEIWGQGGLYRSSGHMMFGTEDGNWYFQSQNNTRAYFASGDGNLWMQWGGWLSDLLAAKQNASTAITTSNIGSQSVASASQVSGVSVSATEMNRLKTTLGVTGLPYSCDIVVEGRSDTYYPVHFIWGDQDVWRRIIIKRGYSEQAPDDWYSPTHKGGLLLDWEGNFGGWGGADYSDRLRVFQESYTTICADMYRTTHSMGYTFFLRGGGAVYHIFSDQNIRGYHQDGVPDIAYDTNFLFYDHSITDYRVYAPAPVTSINSSRIDGLRTKKQSQFDDRYQQSATAINTGNIGSQSVSYATNSGNSATTSQRDFSGDISTSGQGRFAGWYSGNAQTGVAAEIGMSGGQGYIFVYNRQASTYGTLNIAASGANLQISGSTINATSGTLQQGGNNVIHSGNIASQSVSYADESGYSASSGSVEWTSVQNKPSLMPLSGIPSGSDQYVNLRVIGNFNAGAGSGMHIGYGNQNAGNTLLYGGGGTSPQMYVYGDHVYSPSSFRAPIFYDSNDTGFYVDPNSESRLYRLNVGGSGHSLENTEAVLKFRNTASPHNYIVSQGSTWDSWNQWIRYVGDYNTWRIGTYDEAQESGTSVWRLAGRNRGGNSELNYIVAGPRGAWGDSDRVVLWNPYARYDGGSWNGDGTHYQVITAANIGSQSVSYAASAGSVSNADTVDGYHESAFWRDGQDRRIGTLRFSGEGGNSGNGAHAYGIFQEGGDWSPPFPDLRIAFHTGIKLGAHSGYNGIRFYTDYDMSSQVMSVNNGSDPLGGGNVYVNNSLQAGSSLRAPIFYDSNDTTYYGDFASTSYLRHLSVGDVNASNDGGWNARLNLTGSSHARLDVKSNSDGIITTMYSHTGHGLGKIGTYSSHPLAFIVNGSVASGLIWDSTNGSRFVVGESISTPHTIIDSNKRPVIYARGAYPVLTLDHTVTSNGSHGPTVQFVHNGSATSNRQWVIGTNGTGTFLDFGYSDGDNNANFNPHNGIDNYRGTTWMRINSNGAITQLGSLNLRNGFSISQGASNYGVFNSWVRLDGHYGFYAPSHNNAYIYPNNGSYGSWKIDGTRNGWNGIEFGASNGNVSLMILGSGNETGFHNNSYGWQFRWENGTMYCHKNAYGGGTSATVLDSSNYSSFISTGDDRWKNTSPWSSGIYLDRDGLGQESSPFILDEYYSEIGNTIGAFGVRSRQDNTTPLYVSAGGQWNYGTYFALGYYNWGATSWQIAPMFQNGLQWDGSKRDVTLTAANSESRIVINGEMHFYSNYSDYGVIFAAGFLEASDVSLKQNISTITNPISIVKQLRGTRFHWKKDNRRDYGFIAQEVELVAPELVYDSSAGKSVSYSKTVAILTEAIKEQQTLIEQLMARLEALETKYFVY